MDIITDSLDKKQGAMDQRLGYYNSPWPGEDGGPQRLQIPRGISGLNIRPGEKLVSNSRRIMSGNMVVLRDPGQVYMMTIEILRNRIFKKPIHSQIEKIDPVTLKTVKKSPKLKGGNMWPGGFAVHKNGDLYVTYGSHCHRLDPDCNLNYIRVSLDDIQDFNIAPISGLAKGSITNPPLYCPQKKILVAYDSANSVICGFKYAEDSRELSKIWEKTSFGCGGHMIYYQDTGEVVTNDYKRFSDTAVVLDIDTGREKGRANLKSYSQGMVFSCPGWERDFYYLTLSSISRVQVL